MLKELYTAALGMLPQQTRLEMTANNIANSNTTGFKRVAVFEQSLIDARANLNNIRGEAESDDPPLHQFTDFSEGALQKTDNPFDLAVGQEGFFVVQDDDGNESFTRGGHFQIDQEGKVISGDGKFLMSDKGVLTVQSQQNSGLQNDQKAVSIRINDHGEVYANDQYVARIQLVKVENPQTLERVNGMEFTPTNDTRYSIVHPDTVSMKQGYLESSNVNIISEMVAMIQLQRAFEIGQKVITTNDGTLDRSIEISRYS
jgi:flagellar basal body rod protein FlgG